jgi:hypothetical protein
VKGTEWRGLGGVMSEQIKDIQIKKEAILNRF